MRTSESREKAFVALLSVAILGIVMGKSAAVTHVVNFGGTLGNTYSPASFSAAIGDTVKWEGSFSVHPLSSTTIPTSAATWQCQSGNSFSYRIEVGGEYHYKCNVHAGMVGSFTVASVGVINNMSLASTGLTNPSLRIFSDALGRQFARFTLKSTGPVTLRMFDLLGREKATLIDRNMPEGAVTAWLGGKAITPGRYFLRLTADNMESSRIVTIPQ